MSTKSTCGTRTSYVKGCRCHSCRQANTAYATHLARKKNKIAWGALEPDLIDAAPVKAHLATLRASGMGRRVIAKKSGVSLTVISRLLGIDKSKPADRIRPATANKLLALVPGTLANGTYIDATGTIRRIQSLIAIGYTQTHLARILGFTASNLAAFMQQKQVTVRNADAVDKLWLKLQTIPGPSSRARQIAQRKKWPTPLAWADIDTDDVPVITSKDKLLVDEIKIWRKRAGENVNLTKAEIMAATIAWLNDGLSHNEIDRILGQSIGTAFVRMRRANHG